MFETVVQGKKSFINKILFQNRVKEHKKKIELSANTRRQQQQRYQFDYNKQKAAKNTLQTYLLKWMLVTLKVSHRMHKNAFTKYKKYLLKKQNLINCTQKKIKLKSRLTYFFVTLHTENAFKMYQQQLTTHSQIFRSSFVETPL